MINNWFNLFYTDVCIVLHTQCFASVCEKNSQAAWGGIWTHNLLLTSADVLTSRPPSLPEDDWQARILHSSGFRDIYKLMKFLSRVLNNWFNLPYTNVCIARVNFVSFVKQMILKHTRFDKFGMNKDKFTILSISLFGVRQSEVMKHILPFSQGSRPNYDTTWEEALR